MCLTDTISMLFCLNESELKNLCRHGWSGKVCQKRDVGGNDTARTDYWQNFACHIRTDIYFLEQKVYVSSESHVFIPSFFLSQAMRGCSTYTLPYLFYQLVNNNGWHFVCLTHGHTSLGEERKAKIYHWGPS